jgi:hypothetical protein
MLWVTWLSAYFEARVFMLIYTFEGKNADSILLRRQGIISGYSGKNVHPSSDVIILHHYCLIYT